eukprot:6214069-Pleurochrysis_carterae.AAC.2
MPCIFNKAAVLLGKASLHASLHNLKQNRTKALKDKRSYDRHGALLLSPCPKPQNAAGTSQPAVAPVLVVKPTGQTSAQRNAERAYAREAASHAVTKLQRDDARAHLGCESAARAEAQLHAAEASRLSKLVVRLQKELADRISPEQQQVLVADLSLAKRQLRTTKRQLESAETKSARIVGAFKLERDAAMAACNEQAAKCKRYAAKEASTAKVLEKAAGLRSSAAVVDAERRAAAAAAEVERLERSVSSLHSQCESKRSAALTRQVRLEEQCLGERARADSALKSLSELHIGEKCAAADMARLQCNLTSAFATIQTEREQAAVAQAFAAAEAKRDAEFAAAVDVKKMKEGMVHAVLDDPKNLSPIFQQIVSAVHATIPPGGMLLLPAVSSDKNGVITN